MTNQTSKTIATLNVLFPVRVVECDHKRMLEVRAAGKGCWQAATQTELNLVLSMSNHAKNLLEGDSDNAR